MQIGRSGVVAVAAHSALTTGVHGVGTDEIASDADIDTDIATHAAISATASVKAHATAAQITKLNAIETSAARDLTGVEIVALLAALAGDARLAHTALKSVGAADHHAVYLDADALAAAIAGGLNEIIWKDASEEALADTGRTTDLAFTDLDLTAYTSADAKFAILRLFMYVNSITGGNATLDVRKNGTTPDKAGRIKVDANAGDVATSTSQGFVIVAIDADEVMEYEIEVTGTIDLETQIAVLGYIE